VRMRDVRVGFGGVGGVGCVVGCMVRGVQVV
jgi:hypothetical protein